jgi:hypothetical protein
VRHPERDRTRGSAAGTRRGDRVSAGQQASRAWPSRDRVARHLTTATAGPAIVPVSAPGVGPGEPVLVEGPSGWGSCALADGRAGP